MHLRGRDDRGQVRLRSLWLLVVGLSACSATEPTPTGPGHVQPVEPAKKVERFEALLTIDEQPGYKKLQGVWLERDDGERWIAAYRKDPWFEVFDGHRVTVTGERYEPEGQAIQAPHFKVHTLEVVGGHEATPTPEVLSLGPEMDLTGALEIRTVPDGAKLAGDQYPVFVTEDGATYYVPHAMKNQPMGQSIHIVAREYERNPRWAAMRGGRYLWVVRVRPMAQR